MGTTILELDYSIELRPRYGHGKPPHPELYSIVNSNRAKYYNILKESLNYKKLIWEIKDKNVELDKMKPVWNNGFLPGLDIISIYTIMATYMPQKYVEVGSGNSTKVAYKAIKELNLSTEIISIDPHPRTEIDILANEIIREPLEDIDLSIFECLNANDIVFVDNSHRILPNSDSLVFFLEILPRLNRGVIVHIHDVYLPYDYPQFMCDRFYSEQYGLAILLLSNPQKYQPIMPNYFIHCDTELRKVIAPIWEHKNIANVEKHGGSFWLTIV